MTVKLTIEFDTDDDARDFAIWLCEVGEQDFFTWAESNDEPVNAFEYHSPIDPQYPRNDPRRYAKAKFIGDMTIRALKVVEHA